MKIIFRDGQTREAELVAGRTILSYLQELGIEIDASCAGEGKCGQCIVEVDAPPDALSAVTDSERKFIKAENQRLACQARILRTDEQIYVRVPKSGYYILESGEYRWIPIEPFVHREGERVFYNSTYIGEYTGALYGIAIDIGTTTLAAYLVDLETGKVVSVSSRQNPQTKYGNNVISRIEYARQGHDILVREIRTAVNEMIANMSEVAKTKENIYELVIVGNPVMRDLFFGFSVESLGKSPYEPESTEPALTTAKELQLTANPEARVYGLPLIGSFVGADALAVVLATEMYLSKGICLALDVGTNTEIVLGNRERLIATSAASGPAFEGASISCGVGAVQGAIKEVRIVDGSIKYKTIGDAPPVGICGSGLIDVLAELLEHGMIDGRGKFTFTGDEGKELRIADGIKLLETDIDQLNLAKTAIAVGVRVLLEKYGISFDDIELLLLAGGFVNFANTDNAIRIGLLPPIAREKVKKVGNAALEGARQALVSKRKRNEAEEVAKRIEHIKLEEEQDFMEKFVSELYFQNYLE
ncbi:MAG: hypothetical protein C4B56_04285 [Candidatus Methanophagaceae archaeon]|nr:MAG: hypothetical protein C4B56_04285 [Methanophagales archaeon]